MVIEFYKFHKTTAALTYYRETFGESCTLQLQLIKPQHNIHTNIYFLFFNMNRKVRPVFV